MNTLQETEMLFFSDRSGPSPPLCGESLTLLGCCAARERLVMQPDGRCVRAKTDGSNGLRSQERLYELAAVDRSRTGIDSSA
jgi:hypothetical protein